MSAQKKNNIMKKVFYLLLLPFLAACLSEERTKTVPPTCTDFSLACELQKEYILVQPLEVDSAGKDAYGFQIQPNSLYVIKDSTILKIYDRMVEGTVSFNGGMINEKPYIETCFRDKKLKSDTLLLKNSPYQLLKFPGIGKMVVYSSGSKRVNLINGSKITFSVD